MSIPLKEKPGPEEDIVTWRPDEISRLKTSAERAIRSASHLARILWLFSESDIIIWLVPNVAFGVLGALSYTPLTTAPVPTVWHILRRLPYLLLFSWYNTLLFDLSNQRTPESIVEDRANKPTRPIAAGLVTPDQARRGLLCLVPLVVACNYLLGVSQEGFLYLVLNWMYNDLGGGDEWLGREPMLAVGYGCVNAAAVRIVVGGGGHGAAELNREGFIWIALVSAAILTTMAVQDLKDQEGDRLRERRTLPLVIGDASSRAIVAFSVLFWSCVCYLFFLRLGTAWWCCAVPMLPAAVVAVRLALVSGPRADRLTFVVWAWWLMSLYALPAVSRLGAGLETFLVPW